MDDIRKGDLAVVVAGLLPNIGRIVYVSDYVELVDFSPMQYPPGPGWRIRSVNGIPLERTTVPGMAGISPLGTLQRLERLPEKLQNEMDFAIALNDLADCLKALEEQETEVVPSL